MKYKGLLLLAAVIAAAAVLLAPSLLPDDREQLKLVVLTPSGPFHVNTVVTTIFYVQDANMSGYVSMADGPMIHIEVFDPSGALRLDRTLASDAGPNHLCPQVNLDRPGVWVFKFTPASEIAGYRNPEPVIREVTANILA